MRHEMLVAQENLVTDVQFLLQDLMRKNNMSRAELARRSGLSKGLIVRVMTPGANPSLRALATLACALGCKLRIVAR